MEQLEDRRLLAAVTFVNDNWHLVDDVDGSNSVTAGDVVDDRNDHGGTPMDTFTLDDGSGAVGNAFGAVTSGNHTGSVPAADTIQEAIGATDVGGTVNVLAGTYDGNLSIQNPVNLIGAGSGVTTITTSASVEYLILIGNNSVPTFSQGMTIDGFTLVSSALTGDRDLIGLRASGPSSADPITISNNVFDGESLNKGIETRSGGGTAHIVVEGNEFVKTRYAMFLNSAVDWQIVDNTFTDSVVGGLELNTSEVNQLHDVLIEGNVFTNTSSLAGFAGNPFLAALNIASTARDIQVRDNQFLDSLNHGLVIHDRGSVDFTGIKIENNLIQGTELAGVFVFDAGTLGAWSGAFASFAGNVFVDNQFQVDDQSAAVDLQALLDNNAFDRAVTVRDSGINAPTIFSSIQDGIDDADSDDTVQVEAGTYTEDVNVNKTVNLIGANAGISAGPNGGVRGAESTVDGGFRIFANDVTIDGFEILNGVGPAGIGDITAVFFAASTRGHTIANNIITGDGVAANRRGILSTFNGSNDDILIKHNEISHWITGIFNQGNNNVEVSCNSIHHNVAGVGNHLVDDVRIQKNDFKENAEAVGTEDSTDLKVNNNDLDGNDLGVANYGGDEVDAAFNWWGTTDPDEIETRVLGDVNFTPWLVDSVFGGNALFFSNGGATLTVNTETGDYVFVDNGVVYAGTGARIQKGKLKIHDQSSNGKIDVMGSADGGITVSLKGGGKPRTFKLDFDGDSIGAIC